MEITDGREFKEPANTAFVPVIKLAKDSQKFMIQIFRGITADSYVINGSRRFRYTPALTLTFLDSDILYP